MSLVAKVFIVINLVLSLVLIAFTAILLAQQSDFKVRSLEKRRATENVKREKSRVSADYDLQIQSLHLLIKQSDADYNNKLQQIQSLESEIQVRKNDADKLAKELDILDGTLKAEEKILRDTKARKAEVDAKVTAIKEQLDQVKRLHTEWVGKLQEEEAKVRELRSRLEGGGS